MTDRPYNAANRKDIRSAEKAQVMLSTIDREVISGLMSLPNGRQWVYEQLARCQTYADPFTPDPYVHAYQSGAKSYGTHLHNQIMLYAPSMYELMIREAYERSIILDRIRTAADRNDLDYGDHGEPHNYDTNGRWIGDGDEPNRPEAN